MKHSSILILTLLVSLGRAETSVQLDKKELACVIGSELSRNLELQHQTFEQKRQALISKLKSLQVYGEILNMKSDYYSAEDIMPRIGSFVFNNLDVLSQNAFIPIRSDSVVTGDDWLSAFSVAESRAAFRKLTFKRDEFDFVHDDHLVEKLRGLLNDDAIKNVFKVDPKWSAEEVAEYEKNGKGFSTNGLAFYYDANDKNKALVASYVSRVNRFASPLYLWLIEQPLSSVTSLQYFKKALEIYKDPWAALGVMSYILFYEENTVETRGKASVAASRLKSLDPKARAQAGMKYHFWNYLVRGIIQYPASSSKFDWLSWGYERVYQKDFEERASDVAGLNTAKLATAFINGKLDCSKKPHVEP